VDEAAKQIAAFDLRVARWSGCASRFGRDERERAMRPLRVVVGHVGAEHVREVAAADDQHPVETLGAHRTDETFGVGVRLRRPDRRMDHPDPFATKDLVESRTELAVAVVDQEPRPVGTPVKLRLRACWVTQAPVGLVVQPAKWILRLASSIKKRT
jgi:hypothetical protein